MVLLRSSRWLILAGQLMLFACSGDEAGDTESPLSRLGPKPVEGFSRLVQLPNGDAMIIPTHYELIAIQGIDSSPGVLEDARGNPMGYYDIGGNAGIQVVAEGVEGDMSAFGVPSGMQDRAVNQVFHYRLDRGASDEGGGWVATFAERGANFWGEAFLSREEFLGWMRTYRSSGEEVVE